MRSHIFSRILVASMYILPLPALTHASADVYELRTYTTNEGKLDALNDRFRDDTVRLFKEHGIESVGYWVPVDEPESTNTLIYVLKHKNRDVARESWKAFIADPEWKSVAKESQKDGRILAKAPESVYMEAADYTREDTDDAPAEDAVFELRIYRTNTGKLQNLDTRFRDHTIRLFSRHGMKSVAYWHPFDEPDSENTLIYILRHQSRDAAKSSWKAFVGDPEWRKVAKESQKDGPFLLEAPESIYMKATDYSAIR